MEPGLALLLHVLHLLAVPALDGLLLGPGVACGLVEELFSAIRRSSLLEPDGIDEF